MPELHDENDAGDEHDDDDDDDDDGNDGDDGDEGDEGGDVGGDVGDHVVVLVTVVVSASESFFRQRAGCWQRPSVFRNSLVSLVDGASQRKRAPWCEALSLTDLLGRASLRFG